MSAPPGGGSSTPFLSFSGPLSETAELREKHEFNALMDVVTPSLASVSLSSRRAAPREAGRDAAEADDAVALDGGREGENPGSRASTSAASYHRPTVQGNPTTTPHKKANSTSTMFVRSTVANPDSREVSHAVAAVLHAIMLRGAVTGGVAPPLLQGMVMVFDERFYVPHPERKRLRWGLLEEPATSRSVKHVELTSSDPNARGMESALMAPVVLDEVVPPPSTETLSGSLVDEVNRISISSAPSSVSEGSKRIVRAKRPQDATPVQDPQRTPAAAPAPVYRFRPDADEGLPPPDEIYNFIARTNKRASFSPEVTIVSLVLLNRLLTVAPPSVGLVVTAYNWRLLWLCSLLVAQKVWDDCSLANQDFPILWRHAVHVNHDRLDVRAFNLMEVRFLELVNFNVFVSAPLYAQFSFELRAVYEANSPSRHFPLTPLSSEGAQRLEALSGITPKALRTAVKVQSKSYSSGVGAEPLPGARGLAVLS